MRKYFLLLMTLLFYSISADEVFDDDLILSLEPEGYVFFLKYKHNYILLNDYDKTYQIVSEEIFSIDQYGYMKLSTHDMNKYIIPGISWDDSFEVSIINHLRENYVIKPKSNDHKWNNLIINKITASSSLVENTKNGIFTFIPENLLYRFSGDDNKLSQYNIDFDILPWVEGVDGFGYDEYIEVEFINPQSSVNILNGYVNLLKPQLYHDNNRIKEAMLVLYDGTEYYEMNISFMDYVYFKHVNFGKPIKKLKLVIKSVYEGEKYNDTCISSIFPEFFKRNDPKKLYETVIKDYRKQK